MTGTFPPKIPVVVSAAVRRGDTLLFSRYAYGAWKGQWTFPSGFVEEHEQPDAAAVRETREETGIDAEIEGLASVMTMVWDDKPMLYVVFLARYVDGEPDPDGTEVDGAAFWGLDHLRSAELHFDGHNAWLAERILTGEAPVLRPCASEHWHPTYRITFG